MLDIANFPKYFAKAALFMPIVLPKRRKSATGVKRRYLVAVIRGTSTTAVEAAVFALPGARGCVARPIRACIIRGGHCSVDSAVLAVIKPAVNAFTLRN